MDRIGQDLLLFSQSLNALWLLIPQVFLLCVSRSLYLRKGWRGLAAPAAALFSGFVVVGDYLLLGVFEITGLYLRSDTGRVIYILGSNILDIFPCVLLGILLFSYDGNVLDECRRLRGLANPNKLTAHNGKRGILFAILSFVLPISILTSPLGLVRSQSKLHGISKGTIEPRGKGMVVLALAIYASVIVAVCIISGLSIAALHFAKLEHHEYFDALYRNSLLHLPLHLGLKVPWLTVGFPFAVVMLGGFFVQRCYGIVRSLLGCTGVLLLVISSIPEEYNGIIPQATSHIGLEVLALLMLTTALWIPQQIKNKTIKSVVK
jgi:hypothetical protein|tara:strand:+ start:17 stop:976 length:960 start_codon:yes stop_codon:yes gene_type:complete